MSENPIVTPELDSLDYAILKELIINGRTGVRKLARKLDKAVATIASRLKRLERIGVIKGYTAIVDYRLLGYQINALTLMQVDGTHIEEVEGLLAKEPNVRAVYDITGEYDIAIISSFRSVEELDKFIKKVIRIPYVKRSMTSIAFRIVKETIHVEDFLKSPS